MDYKKMFMNKEDYKKFIEIMRDSGIDEGVFIKFISDKFVSIIESSIQSEFDFK